MTKASTVSRLPSSGPADLWSISRNEPARRDVSHLLVAVASTSGTRVEGNFEDAEAFLLFDKCGQDTCFVGRQPCSLTTAGEDPFERLRLLADCDVVLCTGISETCMNSLSTLGVTCNLADAGMAVSDLVATL
jgi:hypothetical protein